MRFTAVILSLFTAHFLMSCDLDTGEDVGPINGDVLILVADSHFEVGPPFIVVHFETEELEPCSNYEILSEFSIAGDVIVSDFEGIFRPSLCNSPKGPATSSNFTELQDGEYLLEINYEENTDLYSIVITADSISMIPEHDNFTHAPFEVSWRYPENSFALLCGTSGASGPCDDFGEMLNDSLNLEKFSFPDRGFKPYPDSTRGYNYNAAGLYFIYDEPADFDQAVTLLAAYDSEIHAGDSGIAIVLINWEARQFGIGQ